MSKKVNPAAVGIFVAGALVILVAGIIVLGSGKMFEKRAKFIIYFQSSANGLSEGSDVLLGGVKVGSVRRMFVEFDPKTKERVIPVIIELSANRIAALSPSSDSTKDDVLSKESLDEAIRENGLRARLMSKSALTGQLYVDLNFFADDAAGYTFPGETIDEHQQIPSIKTEMEQVLSSLTESLEALREADVPSLIKNANKLVTDLDTKILDLDFKGISDKANSTLANADTAMDGLREIVQDERLSNTIGNIDEATANLKEVVAAIDPKKINALLTNVGEAALNISALTDQRAALAVNLTRALTGVGKATKSLEELMDFLKRNPNSLLTGKKRP